MAVFQLPQNRQPLKDAVSDVAIRMDGFAVAADILACRIQDAPHPRGLANDKRFGALQRMIYELQDQVAELRKLTREG